MRARYTRETGLEPETNCAAFQAWLRERYAALMPARRRPYDAALHHDQGEHHPECMAEPIPGDPPHRKAIREERGRRGPALEARGIPEAVERATLNVRWNAANEPGGSADVEAQRLEPEDEESHVHLRVAYPPKVAVSNLVNRLKGVASRLLCKERQDIAPRCWKGALWSPSYLAGSGGGAPVATIRQYIEEQRTPP